MATEYQKLSVDKEPLYDTSSTDEPGHKDAESQGILLKVKQMLQPERIAEINEEEGRYSSFIIYALDWVVLLLISAVCGGSDPSGQPLMAQLGGTFLFALMWLGACCVDKCGHRVTEMEPSSPSCTMFQPISEMYKKYNRTFQGVSLMFYVIIVYPAHTYAIYEYDGFDCHTMAMMHASNDPAFCSWESQFWVFDLRLWSALMGPVFLGIHSYYFFCWGGEWNAVVYRSEATKSFYRKGLYGSKIFRNLRKIAIGHWGQLYVGILSLALFDSKTRKFTYNPSFWFLAIMQLAWFFCGLSWMIWTYCAIPNISSLQFLENKSDAAELSRGEREMSCGVCCLACCCTRCMLAMLLVECVMLIYFVVGLVFVSFPKYWVFTIVHVRAFFVVFPVLT